MLAIFRFSATNLRFCSPGVEYDGQRDMMVDPNMVDGNLLQEGDIVSFKYYYQSRIIRNLLLTYF